MSPEFNVMLETAREYCRVIESIDTDPAWLDKVSELLPRLHASISALGVSRRNPDVAVHVDLDVRFELFSKLHERLGERDPYWMEFDVAPDGQQMSGSLADDLTDIYCELKHGLMMLEENPDPGRALRSLREGYRMHWGQHLIDAERHLYELSATGQLSS